jgi:hypothetical protein
MRFALTSHRLVLGLVAGSLLAASVAGAASAADLTQPFVSGLPGGGQVPSSVVDAASCTSFLTSGGLDPSGSAQVCQSADSLTQLFGGSQTFNKVFSCIYTQSANLVAGGSLDRTMLANCLGLPPS